MVKMTKRIFLATMALFLVGTWCAQGQGPFCGAVGTIGCNAIRYDSNIVAAWATGCVVERGPVDIVNPGGPRVRYGADSMAVGPASTVTTVAVSLGDGGTATLTFGEPIRNIPGSDFAVFENSFNDYFLELAFVEVSTDGERYVRFPATSLTQTETQVVGSVDPTLINNLAGKFKVGYGTPFDLDELCDSTGIDLDNINYVRLVDVVGTIDPQYATYDAFGHIVNDPYPTNDTIWASGGFDLTGVAVLRQVTDGVEEVRMAEVRIWPNPTTDRLTVSGAEGASLALYDLTGRCLMQVVRCGLRTDLDLNALNAGIYMLRVDGKTYRVVKR